MERRLSAILAADVVGYTRLMGQDEAGTLRRLTALRRDFIEPLIAEHRGRVVKLMGDGLLVEFVSAVDTVSCALAWQQGACEHQAECDEESQLRFRIGINLGEVIVEEGDIHGDGVNIAARLESLAEPDGICLSEDVWRQVKGKLEANFDDMGEQSLKNVAEPLRVFRAVAGAAEAIAPAPYRPDDQSSEPTLAFIPFRHLGDPAQSYVTEGLTETLTAALSLFIEFAFVDALSREDASAATLVLEGSVQVAGNRARVAVQLSEAASGRKIWGTTLDHTTEDVFALQDDVVGTIASTMGEAVWEESAKALSEKPEAAFSAYDWTIKSIQQIHRVDPKENVLARASAEKALALAPDLSVASICICWTYITEMINGWSVGRPDAYEYCMGVVKEELKKNERFDHAHRVLARLYHIGGHHQEALKHSQRALEINPYNSDMIISYGFSLLIAGQTEQGVAEVERACRINPYAPKFYQVYRAQGYFLLNRCEEAVALLQSFERPIGSSRLVLAASLVELGRQEEAEAQIRAHLSDHSEATLEQIAESFPLQKAADLDAYLSALAKAGLPPARIPSDSGEAALPLPDKPSIAVLPLDNMSTDPEQEYFSDGITEDIITELARFPTLFVIARNSTFSYKGTAVDIKQVAADLGVRYVLEGSIRRAGNRVRITVQLIDSETGNHLWAERYDRELEDIFALQEEITRNVVSSIAPQIEQAELARVLGSKSVKFSSYDLALKALALFYESARRGSPEVFHRALDTAKEALGQDPRNVSALWVLAWASAEGYLYRWSEDPKQLLEQAGKAVDRLMEIDSSDPRAFAARGLVQQFRGNFDTAVADFHYAFELSPNFSINIFSMAWCESLSGHTEQAKDHAALGLRLSPRENEIWLGVAYLALAQASFAEGDLEETKKAAKLAIQMHPKAPIRRALMIACCAQSGDFDEAKKHADFLNSFSPDFIPSLLNGDLTLYKMPEHNTALIDGLRKLQDVR